MRGVTETVNPQVANLIGELILSPYWTSVMGYPQYEIYQFGGQYSWQLHNKFLSRIITDCNTPNSPLILPSMIGNAPSIITVTIGHHRLSCGYDHDLLIAKIGEGLETYWYTKSRTENPRIDRLDSWEQVSRLLTYKENSGAPRIDYWDLYEPSPSFSSSYRLLANLNVRGSSLFELLQHLGSSNPTP